MTRKVGFYDRSSPTKPLVKLIRVGHFLWGELHRARKSGYVIEERALYAAIETVARLKTEMRAELGEQRKAKTERLQAKFRSAAPVGH